MTQKALILKYLEHARMMFPDYGWVRAYHLRGKHTDEGFLGHQADRRARELANEGTIEHRLNDGYAEYRAKVMELKKIETAYWIPPRERLKREEKVEVKEQAKLFT